MRKKLSDLLTSVLLLTITTLICFGFFHLGNKSTANVTILYTLTLILISLKTTGYRWGILSAIFCVFAVNYLFSYPYMKLNFILDGYPVTFLGMLAIALITCTVTTSMKRQQQAIAEREKALMEADKEKLRANLLRAVSHDLRTPLTSIIGSADSYLEDSQELSEEEKEELISNIKDDSEWLLNMVENLLTVTRINSISGNQVKKSPEVVEEVVSEAIQRLQKRIGKFGIEVTMPNNFLMIPMDPTLIEQVLINLIENAVTHSQSTAPVQLTIQDHTDQISFSVRDYGIGLDSSQLSRIFEDQQSLPRTISSKSSDSHKGLGIGLSICKTIIQAHSGTISAVSHPDGAEFIFTLPKEEED